MLLGHFVRGSAGVAGGFVPEEIEAKAFLMRSTLAWWNFSALSSWGALGELECGAFGAVGVGGFFGGAAAVVPLVVGGPGVAVAFVDAEFVGVEAFLQVFAVEGDGYCEE